MLQRLYGLFYSVFSRFLVCVSPLSEDLSLVFQLLDRNKNSPQIKTRGQEKSKEMKTQQRNSVPSNLIPGFRPVDEDLQGQTFLT